MGIDHVLAPSQLDGAPTHNIDREERSDGDSLQVAFSTKVARKGKI
jgi:hypothetical protein